jgi:hypothetical protein
MTLKPRRVSVALLTLLGAVLLFFSFASARLAYSGSDYNVGPVKLSELSAGREPVGSALRGMRATAAAYAAGFAVLLLGIVLGPYRRGDATAFWVLLAGVLTFSMIYLARLLLLGSFGGALAGLIQAVLALAALAIGRFEHRPPAPPPPPAVPASQPPGARA